MRRVDTLDAIGNTPLVELPRITPKKGVRIFAKMEGNNPTGSLKDRIAKYMIEHAERSGELTKDKTILEPTSGNTGIALAMIGRRKGYKVKVVIPENATPERRQLLEIFGAEMIYSDGTKGSNGAIELAQKLAAEDETLYMPYQYGNPANPLAAHGSRSSAQGGQPEDQGDRRRASSGRPGSGASQPGRGLHPSDP